MAPANKTSNHRHLMKRPSRRGFKHLIAALSAVALSGLAFWLLWNQAGVRLLAVPPLTYWQALGAMLLTGVVLRLCRRAVGRHRSRPPSPPPGARWMHVDPMPFWRQDT